MARKYTLGKRAELVSVTRSRILGSAREAVVAGGLDGLRLEDIAVRAGVSRATVYHHFRSRQGLLEALLECELESGAMHPVHRLTAGPSGAATLRQLILETCRAWRAERRLLDVLTVLVAEQRGPQDRVDGDLARQRQRLSEVVDRVIDEHVLQSGWSRGDAFDMAWLLTRFSTVESIASGGGEPERLLLRLLDTLLVREAVAR